jgi:hypothetical protein
MATLQPMPPVAINTTMLSQWGSLWLGTNGSRGNRKKANCFDKKQSMDFGKIVL